MEIPAPCVSGDRQQTCVASPEDDELIVRSQQARDISSAAMDGLNVELKDPQGTGAIEDTAEAKTVGETAAAETPQPVMSEEEIRLAEQAGRGEIEAFTQLFETRRERLQALIRKSCPNANTSDVDDMTQIVFERAFNAMSKFERINFGGWLYAITRNVITDRYRYEKRFISGEGAERALESIPSPQGPIQAVRMAAILARMQTLVRGDPRRESMDLVDLFYHTAIQGLNLVEYAALRGIPADTARTRAHRGRTFFRKMRAEGYFRDFFDDSGADGTTL